MNSAMIDVALGLALIYAILSLFVTVLQEWIVNSMGRRRGRHLELIVRSAFAENKLLSEQFFNHPLMQSMSMKSGERKPSYISPELFTKTYLAVLGQGTHPATAGLTPAAFVAALGQGNLKQSQALVQALSTVVQGTPNDWPAFEAQVGGWFQDIGERSRGWFARESQRWALLLAALLAVGLNVDSVLIATTLWNNADLRNQLAAAAQQVDAVRQSASSPGSAPLRAEAPLQSVATLDARVLQLDADLSQLAARMGQDDYLSDDELGKVGCGRALLKPTGETSGATGALRQADLSAGVVGSERTHCDLPQLLKAPRGGKPFLAVEWPDDVTRLRLTLSAARHQTEVDADLRRSPVLETALQSSARTLREMSDEMMAVQSLMTHASSVKLLADLQLRLRTLERAASEVAELARRSTAELGAVKDCRQVFQDQPALLDNCQSLTRQQALFGLPLGYSVPVLMHQVARQDLKTLKQSDSIWQRIALAFAGGAWAGWLLTALALSQGAPFWFDLLGRLVKMRTSGTPERPDSGTRAGAGGSAGTAPAPAPAPGPAPAALGTPAALAAGPAPDGTGAGGTSDLGSAFEMTLSDDEIRRVQQRLAVPETGWFDAATRQAIALRRRQLGGTDGAVLDATLYEDILARRSLAVQARTALRAGMDNAAVADLRQRLSGTLGLPARAQGSGTLFDPLMVAAVSLFQGRAGLKLDAEVGDQTWRALDLVGAASVPADAWMKLAIGELGLSENTAADVPRITEFLLAAAALPPPTTTAWCACFVTWVLQQAACQPPAPSAPAMASSWADWGQAAAPDAYGAVTVLKCINGRNSGHFHVGFLVGRSTKNGWVLLGGNQGEDGCVSVVSFGNANYEVVAQRWPQSTPGGRV
jgi:uncharacterized protein (TIGR02594 family)